MPEGDKPRANWVRETVYKEKEAERIKTYLDNLGSDYVMRRTVKTDLRGDTNVQIVFEFPQNALMNAIKDGSMVLAKTVDPGERG